MSGDISSLSIPLWIMAGMSILEALSLIGIAIGGYLVYSRVMTLVTDLEARHLAPVREKVDVILGDVQIVTSRVAHQTERVDEAVTGTIHRVDETGARLRAGVSDKVNQAAGVVRGIRAAIVSLLQRESHA
jgi:hypothetical protein